MSLSDSEKLQFEPLLQAELDTLTLHNWYRLGMSQVQAWIEAGRPR
ncbi:hypothetical protein [Pseudomonas sp. Irchel s3f19]|nr:hypothetical protein [Pseudomonas sp. Irchel s3f19]